MELKFPLVLAVALFFSFGCVEDVTKSYSALDQEVGRMMGMGPERVNYSAFDYNIYMKVGGNESEHQKLIQNTQTPNMQAPSEEACSRDPNQSSRDECYVQLVYTHPESAYFTSCEKISTAQWRENCYYAIAINENNLGLCNLIEDQLHHYICYKQVAINTGNSSICELVGRDDWKTECREQVSNPPNYMKSSSSEPLIQPNNMLQAEAEKIEAETPGSYWTEWYNRDTPGGTGDWETLVEMPVPCSPIAVECKTANEEVDYAATGQAVVAKLSVGCYCDNNKNNNACLDYKVRFLCPP